MGEIECSVCGPEMSFETEEELNKHRAEMHPEKA